MKRQEPIVALPINQINVLLAEDYANFRKNLKILIELDGDIAVVGEAKNGFEAVQQARILNPDVVVMDIAMPMLSGLEATRQIMEISSEIKVIILSAHLDPEYIKQAMIMGASGYLIKQSSAQFLAQAIREVMKGKAYFSASISKPLSNECEKIFNKAESLKKTA